MGVRASCLDQSSLFRFADEYALQKGQLRRTEMSLFTEKAFTRVARFFLSMLGVALILGAIMADTALKMPNYIYYISRTQIFVASIIIFLAAAISRQRFQRFGAYRVTRAIFAFLAVTGSESSAQNGA